MASVSPRMTLALALVSACQSQSPAATTIPAATAPLDSAPPVTPTAPTGTAPAPTPQPSKSPPRTGFVPETRVTIAGRDRTYAMFVPTNYDAQKAYPLIAVMHGDGGTGAQIRGVFGLEAAAADGAIIVYPDGLNHTWKQADKPETNEDFFFFDAMIAKTLDAYHVDSKRIFATGFSSGGYMANQLGCYRGGTLRAIAPMSGGGPYDAAGGHYDAEGHLTCNGKPVAAMMIHGDADGVVPFNEAQKSLSHWSWANHCDSAWPKDGADACKAAVCAQPVTFCTVHGKGHQIWSEAPARVWQFFSGFR